MANPPVDTEVQQVLAGPTEWREKDIYEVLFADRDGKHSFFVPKGDAAPTDGGKERGWFDVKQNGEPKFSRASDKAPANGGQSRPRGSSGPSTDPDTRESIERQQTGDFVLRFMAQMAEKWEFNRNSFAGDFDFLFDKVYGRISERPASPASE